MKFQSVKAFQRPKKCAKVRIVQSKIMFGVWNEYYQNLEDSTDCESGLLEKSIVKEEKPETSNVGHVFERKTSKHIVNDLNINFSESEFCAVDIINTSSYETTLKISFPSKLDLFSNLTLNSPRRINFECDGNRKFEELNIIDSHDILKYAMPSIRNKICETLCNYNGHFFNASSISNKNTFSKIQKSLITYPNVINFEEKCWFLAMITNPTSLKVLNNYFLIDSMMERDLQIVNPTKHLFNNLNSFKTTNYINLKVNMNISELTATLMVIMEPKIITKMNLTSFNHLWERLNFYQISIVVCKLNFLISVAFYLLFQVPVMNNKLSSILSYKYGTLFETEKFVRDMLKFTNSNAIAKLNKNFFAAIINYPLNYFLFSNACISYDNYSLKNLIIRSTFQEFTSKIRLNLLRCPKSIMEKSEKEMKTGTANFIEVNSLIFKVPLWIIENNRNKLHNCALNVQCAETSYAIDQNTNNIIVNDNNTKDKSIVVNKSLPIEKSNLNNKAGKNIRLKKEKEENTSTKLYLTKIINRSSQNMKLNKWRSKNCVIKNTDKILPTKSQNPISIKREHISKSTKDHCWKSKFIPKYFSKYNEHRHSKCRKMKDINLMITSQFTKKFRLFAAYGNPLKSGVVITKKRSMLWLRKAGYFQNDVNPDVAAKQFLRLSGCKIVMNISEYVTYLTQIFQAKFWNDKVIERLCDTAVPN